MGGDDNRRDLWDGSSRVESGQCWRSEHQSEALLDPGAECDSILVSHRRRKWVGNVLVSVKWFHNTQNDDVTVSGLDVLCHQFVNEKRGDTSSFPSLPLMSVILDKNMFSLTLSCLRNDIIARGHFHSVWYIDIHCLTGNSMCGNECESNAQRERLTFQSRHTCDGNLFQVLLSIELRCACCLYKTSWVSVCERKSNTEREKEGRTRVKERKTRERWKRSEQNELCKKEGSQDTRISRVFSFFLPPNFLHH